MSTSLQRIWEVTELNGAHPAPSLVIRQIKMVGCSTVEFARAMFAECKGRSIRNGSERTPEILLEFFGHTSESVRLVACFVAVKEWAETDVALMRECVTTLLKICYGTKEPLHKEEAATLLSQLRDLSPFAASIVKVAESEERARMAFCTTGQHQAIAEPILPIATFATEVSQSPVCSDYVERPIAVDLSAFAVAASRRIATSLPRAAFFQRYSNLLATT